MFKKSTVLLVLCPIFWSCANVENISKDPRFVDFSRKKLTTKTGLRLYGVNLREKNRDGRYCLTHTDMGEVAMGGGELVARVPRGSSVRFERILRFRSEGVERFEGELFLDANRYPFSYYMGSSVYPESWKLLFESFDMGE